MATYWENSCSFGLRYVSWYKYLIVSLVFSHLGFWSGNLFLIAPFPDLCYLYLFTQAFPLMITLGWILAASAQDTPYNRFTLSYIRGRSPFSGVGNSGYDNLPLYTYLEQFLALPSHLLFP